MTDRKHGVLRYVLLSVLCCICAACFAFAAASPTAAHADGNSIGSFGMLYGASVRLTGDGLRFQAKLDEATREYIFGDDTVVDGVTTDTGARKLYFIISPEPFFDAVTDDDYFGMASNRRLLVEINDGNKVLWDESVNAYVANGCVYNVKEANRKLKFRATAVIVENGEQIAVADKPVVNDTAEYASRSLYGVINTLVLSGEDVLAGKLTSTYNWFGTESYPVKVSSQADYDNLAALIESGAVGKGVSAVITGDQVTADFEKTDVYYPVTFKRSDGSVIGTVNFAAGEAIAFPTDWISNDMILYGWKLDNDGEVLTAATVTAPSTFYAVTNLKDSLAEFTLKSIDGEAVDGIICLNVASVSALENAETQEELSALIGYEVSEGATVVFAYDKTEMVLSATVTSKNGLTVNARQWDINMKHTFFRQNTLNLGSDSAIVWDSSLDAFREDKTSSSVRGVYKEDGERLAAGLNYVFAFDAEMTDPDEAAELMFEHVETNGTRLRYFIRYNESVGYALYTDYNSYGMGFTGFRHLKTLESGSVRLEVIRKDNTFIMLADGVAVWRQTISMGATQVVLGGEKAENRFRNVSSSTDLSFVSARFAEYENAYLAPLLGASLGKGTFTNDGSTVAAYSGDTLADRKITFSPTDSKIYQTFYYHDGTALAGQYLSLEATFSIGTFNKKINPSIGFYVDGGNTSSTKTLRAYLRCNSTNTNMTSGFGFRIDNGGSPYQIISGYSNTVKAKIELNGNRTRIYVNDVLVFDANTAGSKVANNPTASAYTDTAIKSVNGFRHVGFAFCGAECTVSNIKATTYTRLLYTYESTIQEYVDTIDGGIETGSTLYMGSSFMEYWNKQHNFSENVEGYNVGLAGSHSSDWLQLMDRLVKPFDPSKVVIYLGGNDASSQGNEMAPYVAQSVIRMLEAVHAAAPNAQIYWLSLTSFPSLNQYNNRSMAIVNEITKAHIDETDYLHYVDICSTLTPNNVAVPEYYGSDGVHLNDLGYEIVEGLIKTAIGD